MEDIAGNTVYIKQLKSNANSEQIEIQDYAAGIYFVKVLVNDQVSTQKIIKN